MSEGQRAAPSVRPLCIYHGHCPDGFTAAWVVNKALEGNVDFHAGIYQDAPPDIADRDVIVVDFSYKRSVLHDMAKSARRILILDHHRTAAEDLAGFFTPPDWSVWRNLDGLSQGVRVTALFDMERSGAQLAWDYFTGGSPRPNLIDYVGDRDLWRFQLPHSREVNAVVTSYDYEFRNWDFLDTLMHDHMGVQQAAELGGAIERNHHKDVAELVNVTCRRMRIGGYLVPVANIPHTMASDAGHLMARGEPFAACYFDTPDGRVFSLRSSEDGLDVSAIAKAYGGGGHRHASGFRQPIGWEGDGTGTAPAAGQGATPA